MTRQELLSLKDFLLDTHHDISSPADVRTVKTLWTLFPLLIGDKVEDLLKTLREV